MQKKEIQINRQYRLSRNSVVLFWHKIKCYRHSQGDLGNYLLSYTTSDVYIVPLIKDKTEFSVDILERKRKIFASIVIEEKDLLFIISLERNPSINYLLKII